MFAFDDRNVDLHRRKERPGPRAARRRLSSSGTDSSTRTGWAAPSCPSTSTLRVRQARHRGQAGNGHALVCRRHGTAAGLQSGQRAGSRPDAAARLRRAAAAGARVSGPRALQPHPAGHRARARGVSQADRPAAGGLEEPRPVRGRGRGDDAADPRQSRARPRGRQARRRRRAGVAQPGAHR